MGRARHLLLADVTAGPLAEVCIMECPLVKCENVQSISISTLFY